MKISVGFLVSCALIVYFFAALQGGLYFMKNRFQEVGIALILALYIYSALYSALLPKKFNWTFWALATPLFCLYAMVFYAFIFSVNAETKMFPSIMASRAFLVTMICPVVYFLYQSGYEIKKIERVFFISLVVLLFNYLFHYYRIDMRTAYFSSDHTISALITFDEWRGFRLKAPTYVIMILLLFSGMRLSQKGNIWVKGGCIIIMATSAYVLSIVMSRAAMATVILAVFVYPFFFQKPNRVNILILGVPAGLLLFFFLISILLGAIINHFANDWSFQVRMESWKIAWNSFSQNLIFGFGQHSYYSKSYQQIFDAKFFPSDLGIVGVAFKYGLVGVFLYIFFNLYVMYRLLIANWIYQKYYQKHNPLIWALFIMVTSLLINIILQPGFVFAPGLTLASFSIALTSCYLEEIKHGQRPVF